MRRCAEVEVKRGRGEVDEEGIEEMGGGEGKNVRNVKTNHVIYLI